MDRNSLLSFLVGNGFGIDKEESTYVQTSNMDSATAVYLTKCLMDAGVSSSDIEYFNTFCSGYLQINFEEDEKQKEFVANPIEVKNVLINIFYDKIRNELSEYDGALRDVTSAVAYKEYDLYTNRSDDNGRSLIFEVDGYMYIVSVATTKLD